MQKSDSAGLTLFAESPTSQDFIHKIFSQPILCLNHNRNDNN